VEHIQENIGADEKPVLARVPVKARLKWFNGPKGFGFVNPADRENVDAFLHITTLQRAGIQAIGDGACMICDIEFGQKGAHVKEIIELLDAGTLPQGLASSAFTNSKDLGQIREMQGTVKWYKPDQGFGFVTPEDGMKDVFIHKSCLERHGIIELRTGQRLLMTFRTVPKGREVTGFQILGS